MPTPRRVAAAAILMTLAAVAPPRAVADAIRTSSGLVEGEEAPDGIAVFRGIPYARPPVGNLRWSPPAPPEAWDGVRKANHFSPDCPQAVRKLQYVGETDPGQSEDCLYINVWTGARSPTARLPVMVWIFGGGFQAGSAAVPIYDGTHFAEQGVVLVTLNYRVGVLGFLVHPELSAESAHRTSGNYGILDQIAALKWIKANIAAFGGDPGRVTIFGESAGSTAINILQASPLAKGLFQRVIGESTSQMDASLGLLGRQTLSQGERDGLEFAASAGAKSLADLRSMPVDALLKPHKMFWPLIDDGYVLPGDVYALFAAGRQNDVPTIAGSNAAEGLNLRVPWIKPDTPSEQAAISQLYPDAEGPQIYTDAVEWQARSWAAAQAKTGHAKSYLYWFDQMPPAPADRLQGAIHGAEIVYVFRNFAALNWPWTQSDRRVGELMSKYWVNFASTGDPNGPGLPAWPSYDPSSPRAMEFSPDSHAIPAPREKAYEFIDAYFARRREAAGTPTGGPELLNVDLSGNGEQLAASVPGIALDPHDPSRVYVVWRFISIAKQSGKSQGRGNWECHLSTSTDGGAHFEDQALEWKMPGTPRCNAPYVDVANAGRLYVGATLMAPSLPGAGTSGELPFGRAVIKESTDGGRTWLSTVSAIATDSIARFEPNSAIPGEAKRSPWDGARGVIDHDSGDIYVSGGYPAPPNGAAHSQRFFSVSSDGGETFGMIRAYGSSAWPQRWDSHIVAAHGTLAYSYVAGSAPVRGAVCPCVVFATSTDRGATIVRHYVGSVKNLDTLVHYPPIAADPKHKQRYALSMVSEGRKDILVLVSRDGGAHWRPWRLHQAPGLVAVSRPALTFAPDGTLIVMWRGYHADNIYDVYAAASATESHFGPAVKISTASSHVPEGLESNYAVRGDFLEVVAADRDTIHAAWTDWRTGTEARVYYGRAPLSALVPKRSKSSAAPSVGARGERGEETEHFR